MRYPVLEAVRGGESLLELRSVRLDALGDPSLELDVEHLGHEADSVRFADSRSGTGPARDRRFWHVPHG